MAVAARAVKPVIGFSAATSLARGLSSLRNFFRHLQREGRVENGAIGVMRGPKLPHAVPKPLDVNGARKLLEAGGDVTGAF